MFKIFWSTQFSQVLETKILIQILDLRSAFSKLLTGCQGILNFT